jgi:hypothetical protein
MALPAARAFALHACLRKRGGCRFGGPDYADAELVEDLKRDGRL